MSGTIGNSALKIAKHLSGGITYDQIKKYSRRDYQKIAIVQAHLCNMAIALQRSYMHEQNIKMRGNKFDFDFKMDGVEYKGKFQVKFTQE